MLDAGEW